MGFYAFIFGKGINFLCKTPLKFALKIIYTTFDLAIFTQNLNPKLIICGREQDKWKRRDFLRKSEGR